MPVTVAVNCALCDAVRAALTGLTPTLTLRLAAGVSTTVALADFEPSATLVAVMVTDCVVLIAEGAVYKPFARLPNEGLMDQMTEVFALPVTLAVNCRLCDAERVAFKGITPTLTLAGPEGMRCTVTLADLDGSATLVAVIVIDCAELIEEGAE